MKSVSCTEVNPESWTQPLESLTETFSRSLLK